MIFRHRAHIPLLHIFKDTLGLEKVPRPRTPYQYRADPGITATLQRLQRTVAWELWMKERIAAMDPTGNPLAKGKAWSTDRTKLSVVSLVKSERKVFRITITQKTFSAFGSCSTRPTKV